MIPIAATEAGAAHGIYVTQTSGKSDQMKIKHLFLSLTLGLGLALALCLSVSAGREARPTPPRANARRQLTPSPLEREEQEPIDSDAALYRRNLPVAESASPEQAQPEIEKFSQGFSASDWDKIQAQLLSLRTWGQTTKITGTTGEYFGSAVAVSRDTVVVGAWGDVDNGNWSGSAYIFERGQNGDGEWGQTAKITAADGAAWDFFGGVVAISGDTIVIGAWGDDDNGFDSGSAYVFSRNEGEADNWGQTAKITATDGITNDCFGETVAVSGDIVVVGTYKDNNDNGSAYIFSRNEGGANNWGQTTKITAADGATDDRFGRGVAVSGDIVVVGAYENDDNGSAYIFSRNEGGADNWGQTAKITAADGATDDHFGWAVAVSGDTAVVGALYDDDNGSAYIFSRNEGGADNWGQTAKITAADGAADDRFGWAVAISGDTVVAGALYNDDNGAAYIFSRNEGGADNWGQTTKIIAADGAAWDEFGHGVAVSGDTVVVGAHLDDDNGHNAGSAYIFTTHTIYLPLVTRLYVTP